MLLSRRILLLVSSCPCRCFEPASRGRVALEVDALASGAGGILVDLDVVGELLLLIGNVLGPILALSLLDLEKEREELELEDLVLDLAVGEKKLG